MKKQQTELKKSIQLDKSKLQDNKQKLNSVEMSCENGIYIVKKQDAKGMQTGLAIQGMGLELANMASQIELNKSQAEKNKAEAEKTAGVDTDAQKATIDNLYRDFK